MYITYLLGRWRSLSPSNESEDNDAHDKAVGSRVCYTACPSHATSATAVVPYPGLIRISFLENETSCYISTRARLEEQRIPIVREGVP